MIIWVQCMQGSKEVLDEGLTFATLDMLEQLSSPAEKLAAPGRAGWRGAPRAQLQGQHGHGVHLRGQDAARQPQPAQLGHQFPLPQVHARCAVKAIPLIAVACRRLS